jgi:hypothetical protein
MHSTRFPRSRPLAAALALMLAAGAPLAHAQSAGTGTGGRASVSGSTGDAGYSMLPYTRQGYVGINIGQAKFDTACGIVPYGCDDSKVSGYFYTGGLINDWLGVELGYMNTGKAERAGGRTRAEGVGASLVARLPMGQFNLFAKGGGMYAQTKVSAGPLSGVDTGKRRAWAPTWGGGAGFDLTPNHGVVLEWNRARLRFPGEGDRRDVDTTSVGYVYRF